jgi:hypothetical protein
MRLDTLAKRLPDDRKPRATGDVPVNPHRRGSSRLGAEPVRPVSVRHNSAPKARIVRRQPCWIDAGAAAFVRGSRSL